MPEILTHAEKALKLPKCVVKSVNFYLEKEKSHVCQKNK